MTGDEPGGRPRHSGLVPGLLLLAVGVGWLLEATGVVDFTLEVWVGLLLIAIGLGIVLDASHPHGLLVAAGVVLVLVGAPAAAIDVDVVSNGVGDEVAAPLTASELEDRYEHGIGQLTIDLTSPDLPQRVDVEASLGIGELRISVPVDATVEVSAQAGIGDLLVLGTEESGLGPELDLTEAGTSSRVVELEADVGIGQVRIERR